MLLNLASFRWPCSNHSGTFHLPCQCLLYAESNQSKVWLAWLLTHASQSCSSWISLGFLVHEGVFTHLGTGIQHSLNVLWKLNMCHKVQVLVNEITTFVYHNRDGETGWARVSVSSWYFWWLSSCNTNGSKLPTHIIIIWSYCKGTFWARVHGETAL